MTTTRETLAQDDDDVTEQELVIPYRRYEGQVVIRQVTELTGQLPNIDIALVILSWALGLPAGAPLALFALGRTVGWIGHALEQYQVDQLIRPRARYNGAPPSTER